MPMNYFPAGGTLGYIVTLDGLPAGDYVASYQLVDQDSGIILQGLVTGAVVPTAGFAQTGDYQFTLFASANDTLNWATFLDNSPRYCFLNGAISNNGAGAPDPTTVLPRIPFVILSEPATI